MNIVFSLLKPDFITDNNKVDDFKKYLINHKDFVIYIVTYDKHFAFDEVEISPERYDKDEIIVDFSLERGTPKIVFRNTNTFKGKIRLLNLPNIKVTTNLNFLNLNSIYVNLENSFFQKGTLRNKVVLFKNCKISYLNLLDVHIKKGVTFKFLNCDIDDIKTDGLDLKGSILFEGNNHIGGKDIYSGSLVQNIKDFNKLIAL